MKNGKLKNAIQYLNQADGSRLVYAAIGNDKHRTCIGRLMPRINAATLAASVGITSHSKTGGALKVKQYDSKSVVNFSDVWESTYNKTYPLADTACAATMRANRAKVSNVVPDIKPKTDGNPSRFVNLHRDD